MDWYKAKEGHDFAPADDPGVKSVHEIYSYYKAYGIKTVVMGASFRNIGEIEELAGCDRLTISPDLLKKLADDQGDAGAQDGAGEGRQEGAGQDPHGREDLPPHAEHGRDGDGEARRRHPPVRGGPADAS